MECGEWNGGKRKEDFCISQFLFLRELVKERQAFALRCLDGRMAFSAYPSGGAGGNIRVCIGSWDMGTVLRP